MEQHYSSLSRESKMAVLPASDIHCVDMTSPSATAGNIAYDAELGPNIIDETRNIGANARHSEY
jgi:hypothetical protein